MPLGEKNLFGALFLACNVSHPLVNPGRRWTKMCWSLAIGTPRCKPLCPSRHIVNGPTVLRCTQVSPSMTTGRHSLVDTQFSVR